MDRRRKNVIWNVVNDDGSVSWEQARTAVLMDIRDELQKLNRVIRENTQKPKRKRKRKATP